MTWLTAAFGELLRQIAAGILGWLRERRAEEALRELGAAGARIEGRAAEAARERAAHDAELAMRRRVDGASDADLDRLFADWPRRGPPPAG